MKPSYHVVPRPGGIWAARRAGSLRGSRVFETKSEAIAWAQERASTVYVHRRDGVVEDVIR